MNCYPHHAVEDGFVYAVLSGSSSYVAVGLLMSKIRPRIIGTRTLAYGCVSKRRNIHLIKYQIIFASAI